MSLPRGVQPIVPGPGQESAWDYPRPPRLEPVSKLVRIKFNGTIIAETRHALRVLETSHPPNYYIPLDDLLPQAFRPSGGSSLCEWKGSARYWDVVVGQRLARRAAWSYPNPSAPYEALRGHLAVYCAMMDECTVDGERAEPQPGGFYGGWVTSEVVGPFKGGPGSHGW